ncbi:phosphotransferase [Cohnella nanjingensis]|uniref:Phosphotransferase n=1 Tax=Cohnella nanjingensis TaxID=1387779 RepID=A0A7X0RQ24_9BACL|nr:phosphotransferase [Cohnella nanjingensis]MBB6671480.1 phosphotransferase [Cohnella nanjingensis]
METDRMWLELTEALRERLGLEVAAAVPLTLGWMNRKWRIRTNRGEYVLKQYHRGRYTDARVPELRRALGQQQRLHEAGLLCPKLLERDGRVLHETASGERFSVMAFCRGEVPAQGRLSPGQLHHLGRLTAEMHRLLNDGTLGSETRPQSVLQSVAERLDYLDGVELALREQGAEDAWLRIVESHRETAAFIDIAELRESPPGWAHRDLWRDNLLVEGDGVAALLDFDRLHYDHPEHDMARALLSGCYADGIYDADRAAHFAAGYRTVLPLPEEAEERALKLLYWIECQWWIRPNMTREGEGPPVQFREEMAWLARRFGGGRG